MTGAAEGPCEEWGILLHGYADGELDAANALRFEQHLAGCAGCAAELERLEALRQAIAQDAVRWPASPALRERVTAAIAREVVRPSTLPAVPITAMLSGLLDYVRRWSLVPALAVLAVGLFLVVSRPEPGQTLQDELVASHVRSLLANHLTDVATSDQHTVKPWFNGKIDFSPPVVDLAARGFPLVGGRVDYVGGRVVAALIYRRNGHVINLFVWPSTTASSATTEREGYSLVNWTQAGLNFWIVSDLNTVEIKEFQEDFAEATPK
jgi:anti-sigma factor RsiW